MSWPKLWGKASDYISFRRRCLQYLCIHFSLLYCFWDWINSVVLIWLRLQESWSCQVLLALVYQWTEKGPMSQKRWDLLLLFFNEVATLAGGLTVNITCSILGDWSWRYLCMETMRLGSTNNCCSLFRNCKSGKKNRWLVTVMSFAHAGRV